MSGLKITCERCASEIEHVCDEGLPEAAIHLFRFTADANFKSVLKKSDFYAEGDEKMPFFTERFLYPLLGKEDARTVLAVVNNLLRAAGLDPHALQTRALADYIEGEREKAQREKDREGRIRRYEEEMKPVSERDVGRVRVLTYRSFQALDNMVYEVEREKKRKFDEPKIDADAGMLTIRETGARVVHEVALSSVRNWLRQRYVMSHRDKRDTIDRSFRAGAALKPALAKILPEVAATIDAESKPTQVLDGGKRLIFDTTQALDEALFEARQRYSEMLREKQKERAEAKMNGIYDFAKRISDTDIERLMEKPYGAPRIVGGHAVISVHDVEYGVQVETLLGATYEGATYEGALSSGYKILHRFVRKNAGTAQGGA